ncbi:unnamed protein product [Effrenium voratum]|uniref:Uncharacterized protein n=1 Tax=Effrenium voratum TaxID=2562239 RepID=A0AA36JE76_9DINO|nr:unnamed protein product [Effrenium voratum]
MERYSKHILSQWLDRQVDRNFVTLSQNCRPALQMGRRMILLQQKLSCIVIRVDGADQASGHILSAYIWPWQMLTSRQEILPRVPLGATNSYENACDAMSSVALWLRSDDAEQLLKAKT